VDDGTVGNGGVDVGSIVRISGPNLGTVDEFVSGLPRAAANHSLNSIHFGPDGRLYVAMGGITGAGQTPATNRGEFKNRREQPLSAALVAFDVKGPGWDPATDGSCASGVRTEAGVPSFPNRIDELGSWTCAADVYATGFRNMYDFVFHSNGGLYGPDNGLGVSGTFPVEETPDCRYLADGVTPAFGDSTLYTQGGDFPGEQPDLLNRIVEGGYYGHPNPSRDECVFKDGSFQGVAADPDYKPPMASLGVGRSADGAIEYTSGAFCGALQGDLLITNFSSGSDVTRVVLTPDGTAVASTSSLFGGFKNPLPIVQGPDGTVYVGEFDQQFFFDGGKITAMVPNSGGCFSDRAPLPAPILDAGSAAVDGRLFVIGGKTTGSVHVNSLYVYDPLLNQWFTGPDKGGLAVENPAVVAHNGKVYFFGGSTGPFAGFRSEVWIYTPGGTNGNQGTWTQGPSMPTARAGAVAEIVGGDIYVAGGLAGPNGGTSQSVVEIFDPVAGTWSVGPSLGTPRDNAGGAVLNGNLYVFGGRTRLDGVDINGTLATVEYLTGGSWQPRSSMPTGRRSFIVGTIGGNAQVMGGESPLFTQNEEYDPSSNTWSILTAMDPGRHGAAHATIDDVVYVAGGGTVSGTSFTDSAVAFQLP
jgi:glucose/arabinose dehydrogenase/N-acetylneuraminic acid mutarotase